MNIKNKKAQSTVEYILLVTAVVAVMIAFSTGMFKTQLNSSVFRAGNDVNIMAQKLPGSHVSPDAPTDTTTPYSVDVTTGVHN